MNTVNAIAQTFLKDKGFYHGPIDGLWGPLSESAADAWKASTEPKPSSTAPLPAPTSTGPATLLSEKGWYQPAIFQPIPGGSDLTNVIFLVIHFTSGATGQSSVDMWRKKADGICAHFVVERDGTVIQACSCNLTCGHAGESKWRDPVTGEVHHNLNNCSIGIEIANAGSDSGALGWARRQPGFKSIQARHPNGGPVQEWECFYPAQLAAVERLSVALIARYGIHSVVGHDQIAPDRRDDPGPALDWPKFRKAINFTQ